MSKKKVAILYGGKSAEYDVSIQTAFSIINAIDKEKYEIMPIHISHEGQWIEGTAIKDKLEHKSQLLLSEKTGNEMAAGKWLTPAAVNPVQSKPDIIFPLLHGPNGEDGTVQGLMELLGIAYVGSGVLGSASGMDKVIMKDLFKAHQLNQPKYLSVTKYEWEHRQSDIFEKIKAAIGCPCFIKPANLGSSIGISQCLEEKAIIKAVNEAFCFDDKVIIEEKIIGREIEIGVLGNDALAASVPGEIKTGGEFYDYQSKYQDGNSTLLISAYLTEEIRTEVEQTAFKAFKILNCKGLARADFFIRDSDRKVIINEINTMPGFTPYSMFPLLWEHSGLSYADLIDRLINLGIERHEERQNIRYRIE
ncbi:D-alanine--D-alanine ligase [Scopulibacillus darangshiensis]|uniref:D-alanine--D-alanine ligase n=1 Tax=Scopulibacillus darangshiensis TaxID=442528 RepID=A0A4R2P3H8_9BACL|nr:D-alanine--D-alanine ligase [Scopulibacillus darangshiensis]TCP29232.1 D-alanine--D-alanine ligase [Scopulibacillus darangshiensis]